MEIAFLPTEFPPYGAGGAARSSSIIVDELRQRGHTVDVYNLLESDERREHGDVERDLSIPEVRFVPEIIRRNIAVLRGYIPYEDYDLVHVYGPAHLPAVVGKSSVPVIGTVINFGWVCVDPQRYLCDNCPQYTIRTGFKYAKSRYDSIPYQVGAPVIESLGKRFANAADTLTVQTPGMRDILMKCGYGSENITVVPNLLDTRFDCRPAGQEYVLFVGRLADEKGPLELLEAYGALPADIKRRFPLKLYGKGPLEPDIREVIRKRRLDSVTLEYADYVDLPDIYRNAAVLTHPAKWPEPFSRTWLEALGTGTPIISARNPSSRSVLADVAAFHDPFDPGTLTQALEECLTDTEVLRRMGESGRQAAQRYQPDVIIDQYVQLYESVVRS